MYYELIIIWSTGEKEIYNYPDYEKAMEIMNGMKKAFGRQIEWTCINERLGSIN